MISPQTEEERIRCRERMRLQALVDADVEKARQFHADAFQLITPVGVALSREEYLGAVASGRIRYLEWEAGEIAVRLQGAIAAIRYRARIALTFEGHPVPSNEYWHTDTYEYLGDRWMVVWSQATAIRAS